MNDERINPTADGKHLHQEVTPWIDDRLSSHGITRLGEIVVTRVRPWATVMSMETSAGRVWLKAAAPATAFEARLYPLLQRHAPDIVLHPIGIDEERGWMLLKDGGATLDTGRDAQQLIDALVSVVPRYASMQRSLAPYVEDMLANGVPDMRPFALPERFDDVIAYSREFASRKGNERYRKLLQRVEPLRSAVIRWASAAGRMVGGVSLDHSDLHARNILVPQRGGLAAATVYDWGDSVVAHPFTSLLVLLRYLMNELQAPAGDRRVQRVIDAYLEPFGDLASRAELMESAMAVCQVGKVTRAHAWMRAVSSQSEPIDPDDASAPLEWLGEMLSPNLLDLD